MNLVSLSIHIKLGGHQCPCWIFRKHRSRRPAVAVSKGPRLTQLRGKPLERAVAV